MVIFYTARVAREEVDEEGPGDFSAGVAWAGDGDLILKAAFLKPGHDVDDSMGQREIY